MSQTAAPRNHRAAWRSINREWEVLTDSRSAAAELARWHRIEPALAAADTVADLPAVIAADPHAALTALCRLYRSGSALAAKTLLRAMAGMLVGLSRHAHLDHGGIDPDEKDAITITAFLDVAHRPHPHASNLAATLRMDTLKRITAPPRPPVVVPLPEPNGTDQTATGSTVHALEAPGPSEDAFTEYRVRQLLDHASAMGVLSGEDRALIERAYLTDSMPTHAELGAELGIAPRAAGMRLRRAVARVRDAALTPRSATRYAAAG